MSGSVRDENLPAYQTQQGLRRKVEDKNEGHPSDVPNGAKKTLIMNGSGHT